MMEGYDARVPQASHISRLAQERRHGIHGAQPITARHFDRDRTLHFLVVAQVDFTEPAAAQPTANLGQHRVRGSSGHQDLRASQILRMRSNVQTPVANRILPRPSGITSIWEWPGRFWGPLLNRQVSYSKPLEE